MFSKLALNQARTFSTSSAALSKVAVLGAGGGIGQPLSLLLKENHDITELSLYDLKGAPGVAADVSHVNTKSVVKGYSPEDNGLEKSLEGADVVVIPAGVPRKPGMTRDDLFNTNASIVRDLAKAAGKVSPKALIAIISNPVNSTVPIVAETLKKLGVYDPKRVFGVTTLDIVRASRFISQIKNTDPASEKVSVVGGHSGATIVPLLSQSNHPDISGETYDALINRIQFGGDEVVKAKAGAGSATLSMAFAGARFAKSLVDGLNGKDVTENTFVESPLYKDQGVPFFSSPVTLGKNGVETIHPIGKITAKEEELLQAALDGLKTNIAKGQKFVAENP